MNRFLWLFFASILALLSLTELASAKKPFASPSFWLDKKQGTCLSVEKSTGPLPGSKECIQISGLRSLMNPLAGYFCEEQNTVSFFSNFGDTDNDIRPEFYIGHYVNKMITAQYCFRPSNDMELEFNCKNEVVFESVDTCPSK